MQAIEFKTTLHNGTVILPPEYSSQWEGKTIRVILLDEAVLPSAIAAPHRIESSVTEIEQSKETGSLLSRLRQIKISAPSDFSENIDAYLNGEKGA
jgi:hypothetical protein